MVRTRTDHIILWPSYFDSRNSRAEGRRIPKSLAVERPAAPDILAAVRALGLEADLQEGKSFPSNWWEKEGCVSVEKTLTKVELISKVAHKLKQMKQQ